MPTKTEKEKRFNELWDNLSEEEQNNIRKELAKELTLKLPDGNVITLNDEQHLGVLKIRRWLKSNIQFFTLAGYAGTGKTTIIKKILDEYRGRVAVSAPTHKAKKVIMKTTERDGETLHALLGLRPDLNLDDFNPNDPIFNIIAPPKITNYNLVIIDEASMINEDLFEMIKNQLKSWGTIKVLFMGDPAQIPPIGEKESIVFNTEIGDKHQLTQIMRQEIGNPLANVYGDLRNNLYDQFGGIDRKTEINSKGEGVTFTNDRKLFREKMFNIFRSKEYDGNIDYAKLIAWRNVTIMQANQLIRNAIFGNDVNFLVKGDVLMAYRSIRAAQQYYNILDNSADYLVANVSKRIKNNYDLWGYKTTIKEKLPNGKDMHRNIFIVDHTDEDNLHNYAEIHDGLKLIAKNDPTKREWNKYYAFRRESLIMVTIKKFRGGNTRIYSDVIAKDLDYGYAITGHKCLSENSKILTKNGNVLLKNIKVGEEVCVGFNMYEKVLDKIPTGIKKSYKIKTDSGYEIICSEDHRILDVNNEFKPLKQFLVNEYIPINRNNVNINMDVNSRDINYYLGLLVADGSYSGNNKKDKYRIDLTINTKDIDNIEYIDNFYNENNLHFGKYVKKKSNCLQYYVTNKNWRNELLTLGLKYVKGSNKSIPQSILYGTYQNKSNFIAGLFDGDGSVNKNGKIILTNNSKQLIKEVQDMLLEFGIVSYFRLVKKSYRLIILNTSIELFKKNINFRLNRKKIILNNYIPTNKTNRDYIPFKDKIFDIVKKDLKHKKGKPIKNKGLNPQNLKKFPTYLKNLSYSNLKYLLELYDFNNKKRNQHIENIYNNNLYYDKIISIEQIGEEKMFDLEINKIHQFVANGFIVHNSQGSTYTHVFVLEDDMTLNPKIKERNQIKYVALTRPTTTATVLTTIK